MMIQFQPFFTDNLYRLIGRLLLGIVVLLMAVGGYYYVQTSQRETLYRNASHEYACLMRESTQTNSQLDEKKAKQFTQRYLNTPYHTLMQFQLAHDAIQRNDLPAAFSALSAVIEHTKDLNVEAIARQRGARVLISMGQFQQAFKLIDHKSCINYSAACHMIKGDIFMALGEKQNALQAYQSAKEISPDIETAQPLLQMKLDDLGNLSETLPL